MRFPLGARQRAKNEIRHLDPEYHCFLEAGKDPAPQRQGMVKVNAGARLVMERASFSLRRQTPARRSTLIPSTLLRGTPRAAALRSFYISSFNTVCVVACSRTTHLSPIPQPSTVVLARSLAMKCLSVATRLPSLCSGILVIQRVHQDVAARVRVQRRQQPQIAQQRVLLLENGEMLGQVRHLTREGLPQLRGSVAFALRRPAQLEHHQHVQAPLLGYKTKKHTRADSDRDTRTLAEVTAPRREGAVSEE